MKILIAALLFTPALSFAEETAKPARTGYQTINLGEPPKELPAAKSGIKVETNTTCETSSGQKINQGDAGFDSCLINNTQTHTRQQETERLRKTGAGR